MRKYSIVLLIALNSFLTFAQDEIKSELPTVIPPSPTVAGLMKFEEVPVSNYTGIPDVSIPLFNTTANHGLEFNISLNYHPSSIKKDDFAGYTGLGWNLISGGSISRTVRDIPDDADIAQSNYSPRKIGIYNTSLNNYYTVLPLLPESHVFDVEDEDINEFLYESNEKNKFDTKHDLYQFNFMGYTGRFIIEKQSNGTYEVVKLDKNNLIIDYNHSTKKFEIKDTKGFTYVFDVIEMSSNRSVNISYKIGDYIQENMLSNYFDFISAFHLSKILYGAEIIAEFKYNGMGEEQRVRNETYNFPLPNSNSLIAAHNSQINCRGDGQSNYIPNGALPTHVINVNTVDVAGKKPRSIKIADRATIEFETTTGDRNDIYYRIPSSAPYLTKVTVKNRDSVVVKSFNLDYQFAHKLFLKEIKEGVSPNQISKYKFNYDNVDFDYRNYDRDYWGYYRLKDYDSLCTGFPFVKKDADIVSCKKDVLKQIIYPTKGSAVFEYESNNYSHIGDDDSYYTNWATHNFDQNPYNWHIEEFDSFVLTNAGRHTPTGVEIDTLFGGNAITSDRIMIFNTSLSDNDQFIYLRKKHPITGNPIEERGINTHGCPIEIKLDSLFKYEVRFVWVDYTIPTSATVYIQEKVRNTSTVKAEYGGGIRIKNIYYTDDDVPEIETQDYPNNYAKKVSYDYNFFTDPTKSSGALVYPKPVMEYQITRKFNSFAGQACPQLLLDTIDYQVYSDSNNLSFISTKGSDVGYQNVTVSESGNGRTEYIYNSPIDFPETISYLNTGYPFLPTLNLDYKRGLLTKATKYDASNRIVHVKKDFYEFENYSITTGLIPYYNNEDCPFAGMFNNYSTYLYAIANPVAGNTLSSAASDCGMLVTDYVNYHRLDEAFGWAKLYKTESEDHFYNGSSVADVVENKTEYAYNANNMKIKSVKKYNSNGDELETKYYYAQDTLMAGEPHISELISSNRVEIPLDIQSFKGTSKLSEQKMTFAIDSTTFGALLPKYIYAKKGSDTDSTLERRIKYNKYDKSGNPLEVQQENGILISYIWGYNKTQPIAKIENASYTSISEALIDAAQLASNTGTEASLITALNAIRTALPNAMVTTFTYIPMVGVSTITDSKGQKQKFVYDAFGRLQDVFDHYGNKVSSNEYNYRP